MGPGISVADKKLEKRDQGYAIAYRNKGKRNAKAQPTTVRKWVLPKKKRTKSSGQKGSKWFQIGRIKKEGTRKTDGGKEKKNEN